MYVHDTNEFKSRPRLFFIDSIFPKKKKLWDELLRRQKKWEVNSPEANYSYVVPECSQRWNMLMQDFFNFRQRKSQQLRNRTIFLRQLQKPRPNLLRQLQKPRLNLLRLLPKVNVAVKNERDCWSFDDQIYLNRRRQVFSLPQEYVFLKWKLFNNWSKFKLNFW